MHQTVHPTQQPCRRSRMSVSGILPEWIAALRPFASNANCGRHQEICNEATYDDYLRQIVSGAAGKYSTQPDGRRQMIDLLLPGDFFAFLSQHDREFTVEAIVESTVVARYPRKRVEALAAADPQLAHELNELAFATLSRTEGMLIILGRVTALEKVGAFLLEMTARLANSSHDDVVLPVSRSDIGDFLAMSAETVSRALSDLKCRGIIRFTGTRHVQIVDRDALEHGSFSDRQSRAA
jgi:CRP/FNR family nitrogen fixation transcriptional regulator